ncbi:MAG: DnaJ C-terminal domain-containing protein [Acidobacteriota bacterium]
MRQPGGGHHGPLGGPPGDLLITCRVQPQPPFERQGPNLQCEVSISVAEAVLGGRVPVPTLGGDAATLRLPPGTQNGRCFRLRGRGLRMPEGRRGDLLIRVRVWIPALVDEDTKRLIHEFGARTGWPRRLSTERATVNQ